MAKVKTTNDGVKTLDDYPGYLEAKERFDRVSARKAELENLMLEAIDDGRRREVEMSKIDREAHRILTGEDLDQAEKAELASFRELEDELKATTRACEIAQAEYERLWRLASSEVVAARQPEHRALVAEITESLKGLVEAIRAEEAWVRDLKDEGVYFVAGLGRTCNPQSKETTPLFAMLRKVNVGAFCERLKRHGYL